MAKSGIFRDDAPINLFVYAEQLEDGAWRWGIGDDNKNVVTVSVHHWEREEDAKIHAGHWLEKMGLIVKGEWK